MELVNNRYKIINSLKQNRMFSTYLVSDMWDENKKMQLNILNFEFLPNSLLELFSNEFIGLINLDNNNIIKDYCFNRISYIDNNKNTKELYFYTCEYIEKSKELMLYIENMSFFEIMNIFIELCKTVHYLHLNGYIYGELNLNNILIVETNTNYNLKLKDLATIELEKNFFVYDKTNNSYFRSPRALSSEKPDSKSDIYSLAVLLLTMLKKQCGKTTPKDELLIFQEELKNNNTRYTANEINYINKLLPIIDKALVSNDEYPYQYIYDMVKDINNSLNKNYQIVSRKELERLNFHTKLIGRKDEINVIMNSYDSMVSYKPANKIFLLQGDTGTGKTRFLEEIKFLFELKNANIYSSFSLNDSNDNNNKLWTEILRKLIFETDAQTIEKYESELMKFFPEIADKKNIAPIDYLNENTTKYRLLNRIAGFINDSIKNKPAVFVIDNIHFANEFTLDTFTYLYKEVVNNKNIILIFSYNENDALYNSRFREFINDIKRRKDSLIINMNNLNEEETGEMIKNMMSMSYVPTTLSKKVYSQSYGNPFFITEIIKELYNSKMIFINDKLGWWYINIPFVNGEDDYYNYLNIPNTIKQVVSNQIKDIDNISHEILNTISIFTKPISIENLSKFIDMDLDELEILVQALVNKGILAKEIEDSGYVYDINNNVLKDIVYEKISSEEKINKHKIAAEILESEKNIYNNFNELILHLEKANIKEKAKEYCIKNAKKMREQKNIKAEINNLKKALSMIKDENLIEKTELLIEIGSIYYEIGNIQLAINSFFEAEKLAKTTNNHKNLIDIYLNIVRIMNVQSDYEKSVKYLDKAKKLLEHFEYPEGSLEVKYIKVGHLINNNFIDESIKLCLEIIDKCGENFPKLKGNTYRLLAYSYTHINKIEESLILYEKSIELFENIGYLRGILIALNNIGGIYNDYYQDFDMSLSYFTKVRDLSEEYGLLSSEVLGLINIAVVYNAKNDYTIAYEHFKLALEKALKINLKSEIFFLYNRLTILCIDMNNYAEAFHYYKLVEKELESNPEQGIDILEYYNTSACLYIEYGDFEKAIKFINKSLGFYKDVDNVNKFEYILDVNLIELKLKEIGSYDSNIDKIVSTNENFYKDEKKTSTLIKAAIILAEKNDYENARKLISKAEKYMVEPIHDKLKANYHYSKGIAKVGKDPIKSLYTSLKLAKKINNKELIAKINIELGNYYFSHENYYYAANYYIEACKILESFINQIPKEYRLIYVNSYKFAIPFYRIQFIKTILIDNEKDNIDTNTQIEKLKNNIKVNSYEDLCKLTNKNFANAFIKDNRFMDIISKQYMQSFLGNILNEKDILIHINGDTISDIQLITKYLAAFTLATRGFVAIEDQKQDLDIIYSIDDNYNLPTNTNVFDKVKTTMEPFLLSDALNINNIYFNFLDEDIRACLCIPIIINNSNSRYNNISYLYLETDRILNNFNYEGLQKCIEFSNLLGLLIDKHQLKLAASIDKLTGALTRKYLEDALNDTLDKANNLGESFSIIMYDIDRFKRVNDKFGHQTGDEVLRRISKLVLDNIGRKNTLGRYGGEEFIIILPGIKSKKALSIANELRKKIQNEKILGEEANVTVSMGVVSYPMHGKTINELIEKVDKALYVAKETGRNKCQLWNNKFINMKKPKSTIGGIITGNEVQNSRNVLAIVELIELVNKNLEKVKKINKFLGRMIETIEAQSGILLLIEDCKIKKSFGRKAHKEKWIDDIYFNKNIVKSVIENKQGICLIDWNDIEKHDLITGLPDWNSILAAPIIVKDQIKGVVYFSASSKNKEFGIDDLNIINVLSNLLATIL